MTLSNPNILTPKRPSRSQTKTLEASLESTNALPTVSFTAEFFPPDWSTWTSPRTCETFVLDACRSAELGEDDFEACFRLIESTSGEDYRGSSVGWSESGKREEMRSPELRYILIRGPSAPASTTPSGVQGFISLMPTFEYAQPVLYIYEIHLSSPLRSAGLGKHLIQNLTIPVAERIPHLEKVMLTCFRSNEVALAFYEKMGFEVDEASPSDRVLRGGRRVTSDYVILSRRIRRP